MIEEQNVIVFNREGERLSNCSYKRALKLVKKSNAKWIAPNQLLVIQTRDDTRAIKKEVIKEANRICYICNRKIPESEAATIDHVVPKLRNGKDKKENFKCCCLRCNNDKARMYLIQYVNHIKKNREDYPYISNSQLKKLEKLGKEYLLYSRRGC